MSAARRAGGALTLALGSLCLASPGLTAQAAGNGPARISAEEWRQDLAVLAERMEALHPDLFFSVPRPEFEAAVARLHDRIPELDDNQVIAGLHEIVALPSRDGRDGHTRMGPLDGYLPLALYVFTDGVFVVDAFSAYEDLVGKRVLAVGATGVDEALGRLDPLTSRDNDWNALEYLPIYLVTPRLLDGVGIVEGDESVDLRLVDGEGGVFTVSVTPVGFEEFGGWFQTGLTFPAATTPLYRSNRLESFWSTRLADSDTYYVQYNAVRSATESGETLAEFAARVQAEIAAQPAARVVVDLRWNGGGDNTTYGPLLEALASPQIDLPGRLFAIVGRLTFSAAGNFVTELRRHTGALLVGEPTGGAPNQYGDAVAVLLPRSGLAALVSTRYHQKSAPDDPRLTHEPDIPVPTSAVDWFAGRDPALEAVLAHAPGDTAR